MPEFDQTVIDYLATQRLGRLATVDGRGRPFLTPLSFRYNPEEDAIEIGGHLNVPGRRWYRNLQQNPHVSFIVDDVLPPWRPRGVEIRGKATAYPTGGKELGRFLGSDQFDDTLIRIRPERIRAWRLEEPAG